MGLFNLKRTTKQASRLGLNKAVRETAVNASANAQLQASVNSAVCVFAAHDIACYNIHRHQISEMLAAVGRPRSWNADLPASIREYVSEEFFRRLDSDLFDDILAVFARYYLTRFPVLTKMNWFLDIPAVVGFSEQDEKEIVVAFTVILEDMFPRTWDRLRGDGPEDPGSIYQQAAAVKRLIERYGIKSPEVHESLHPYQELVNDTLLAFRTTKLKSNAAVLLRAVLEHELESWWTDYRDAFLDTFQQWHLAGAFEGGREYGRSTFWSSLDERTKRREWLVKLGTG